MVSHLADPEGLLRFISEWPVGNYSGDAETFPDRPQLRLMPPPLDNQAGVAELLAKLTAPPLPRFEEEVHTIMGDLAALMVSKQADYGPRAINDSPGGALNGINVRMHDKMSRAVNLTSMTAGPANHESLRDTYRDLANYAVIAVMVLDGTWPQ